MISEKRKLAARANGARSRGPKTAKGKARSSRNAVRHGLLSQCVLLHNESRPVFQTLVDSYVDRFRPIDEVELGLIEEMVSAYWRLRRALAIETRMFDKEMEGLEANTELDRRTTSFGDLASTPKLHLVHRYQARLHLIHSRAIRDLALLRQAHPSASRVPNEPKKFIISNEILEVEPSRDPHPPNRDTPSAPAGTPASTPPAIAGPDPALAAAHLPDSRPDPATPSAALRSARTRRARAVRSSLRRAYRWPLSRPAGRRSPFPGPVGSRGRLRPGGGAGEPASAHWI